MEYIPLSEQKEKMDELNELINEYRELIKSLREKHEEADKMLNEIRTHMKFIKGK